MADTVTIYFRKIGVINQAMLMPEHLLLPLGSDIACTMNMTMNDVSEALHSTEGIIALLDPDDEGHLIAMNYPLDAIKRVFKGPMSYGIADGSSVYITQEVVEAGVYERVEYITNGTRTRYEKLAETNYFEQVDLEGLICANVLCSLFEWHMSHQDVQISSELSTVFDTIDDIHVAAMEDGEFNIGTSLEALCIDVYNNITHLSALGIPTIIMDDIREWYALYDISHDAMFDALDVDMHDASDDVEEVPAAVLGDDNTLEA